jgi:hypothetical protein
MKKMNFMQMEVINGGQTVTTVANFDTEEARINYWLCGYCVLAAAAVASGVAAGVGALELATCIGCYNSARR